MSVFYSLTDKILLEVDYDQNQYNNVNHPLNVVIDGNEESMSLVNGGNDPQFIFNNAESSSYVRTPNRNTLAVLGSSTNYFYPNIDPNISTDSLDVSGVGLQYISIRLHILSGYTFQDIEGFAMGVYVKDTDGKRVYLFRQAFRKFQINRYSYNQTAKNIGDLYYDKFVEFVFIDYNDILTQGINSAFFQDKIDFGDSNVLFAEFLEIKNVEFSAGYEQLFVDDAKTISFSTRDEYDLLVAEILENDKGYLEYKGSWDGGSLQTFLNRVNMLSGNDYVVIHELDIFGQIGNSLTHLETFTQVQTSNFDSTKKTRPIIPNSINGFMRVEYTLRLLNKINGESIIKKSSLVVQDVSPYLEEITRLNIQQLQNPNKAYIKVVNNQSERIRGDISPMKINVPIYVEKQKITLGDGSSLPLDPFDNVYSLTIFQETENGTSLFLLDPFFKHKLVFTKENGSRIEVDEIFDASKRRFSMLTFRVSKSVAQRILANNIDTFHIVAKNETIETVLVKGKINA